MMNLFSEELRGKNHTKKNKKDKNEVRNYPKR